MRLPARAVVLLLLLAAAAVVGYSARAATVGWQAATLDLPRAWQVTSGSPTSVVAIVDSGVQADHPALAGRVLPGYDFVNGDANANDDNGHGTAIAGIVVSVCPGCRILPVKVLDANRAGSWTTVAAGIRWAADNGAQVVNLSIGAPRALDAVGAAVAYALSKGAIVVAAAGNDGLDESFYPADYPGVVSVAGVDENGARSSWSNFGSAVTVAAPGCTTAAWLQGSTKPDFCGTSTAAPFVAGLAGLARAFDPKLTPGVFAAALTASTTSLPDPSTAAFGVPDANRMLVALGAPAAAPTDSAPPTIVVARGKFAARIGTWHAAASYRIEWQRSSGASWIEVGSGRAYTPRPADRGRLLRVLVTAANARGSTTVPSATIRERH